ncbi:MAG: RluA family pseudouridine synthase [Desulfobacteraceae bacterium]|jgi:tRNA pseudouridine32 synthase/23S rRNA pseudouridine746 synthase
MFEIDIIYQDSSIVVVNKPGSLLSVPGRGPDKQDCLVNRIKKIFPECIPQPSVHRLDMDTSGLMVLALTADAHKNLSVQFQNRTVKKQYIAMLEGIVENEQGEINLPFRLDITNRPYQIYDPVNGKMGTTLWEKIEVVNDQTRILFTPLTGRTHQLRLHASHPKGLGCPIVGDRLYGHGKTGDPLLLHATYLSFQYPDKNDTLHFESSSWF